MAKRIGVLAATLVTAAALTLGTAASASADPFFYLRSHHATSEECHAAGQAGRHLWGALYLCRPSPYFSKPVWELWVRL
jgi:hypothetical protein